MLSLEIITNKIYAYTLLIGIKLEISMSAVKNQLIFNNINAWEPTSFKVN